MASLISIKTSVANLKRSFIKSSEVTFLECQYAFSFHNSPEDFALILESQLFPYMLYSIGAGNGNL